MSCWLYGAGDANLDWRSMKVGRNDLTIRSITGLRRWSFCRLSYLLDGELAEDLAAGRRRPEWMWVALHGDRLTARGDLTP